ncbi:MAG: LemA family protein [Candidatus Hydrogenedentota bacterium]
MVSLLGIIIGVILLGIILFVIIVIVIYNALVVLKKQAENAFSQIDVQLKRRHDLIPNLVETVKGYAAHEKDTLERVTKARGAAVSAQGINDKIKAEGELSAALRQLMLLVENYPDLKANQNFLALQEELASTENRIGFARQHFNDSVMLYNTKREVFPSNIVANMFNFQSIDFFKADEKDREAPQVKF